MTALDPPRRSGLPQEETDDLCDDVLIDETPNPAALARYAALQRLATGQEVPHPERARPTVGAVVRGWFGDGDSPRHVGLRMPRPGATAAILGCRPVDVGLETAADLPEVVWLDCEVLDRDGSMVAVRLPGGVSAEDGAEVFLVGRQQVFEA